MRLFEVSGVCQHARCGLTRVPQLLHLTGPDEERDAEALLFLCHYHDGDGHTFRLHEGDRPIIVPYMKKEERRVVPTTPRAVVPATPQPLRRGEDPPEALERQASRFPAKKGSRQARRERQEERDRAAANQ